MAKPSVSTLSSGWFSRPWLTTNLLVLSVVSLLTDVSTEMIVPLLPFLLADSLGSSVAIIGLIEGLAEGVANIGKLGSGWISDKVGRRKPIVVAGYGVSALAKPLFALAGSWQTVLLVRLADRAGKAVRGAPRDALIADDTPKADLGKAFSLREALDTVGAILGPLLAFGAVGYFAGSYQTVFWLAAVPAAIGVVFLQVFLKETARPTKVDSSVGLVSSLRDLPPALRSFILTSSLFSLSSVTVAFLILRAKELGDSVSDATLLYLVVNLAAVLASYPAGAWADRVGRKNVLLLGWMVWAATCVGLAFVTAGWGVWLLFAGYGCFLALTAGVARAYAAELAGSGNKGTALGAFQAAQGFGAMAAGILGGLLWQVAGSTVTFLSLSVLAVAAMARLRLAK